MTWNYRVVNLTDKETGVPWLEVREVYYDTMGMPMGHCTATVGGENVGEIQTILPLMTQALVKPLLKFKEEIKDASLP